MSIVVPRSEVDPLAHHCTELAVCGLVCVSVCLAGGGGGDGELFFFSFSETRSLYIALAILEFTIYTKPSAFAPQVLELKTNMLPCHVCWLV